MRYIVPTTYLVLSTKYKVLSTILLFLSPLTTSLAQTLPSLESSPPEEIVTFIDQSVKKKPSKPVTNWLIRALTDPNASVPVKERAAWALGQLEAKSALNPLIQAAGHKGLLVRSAALNALMRLRSEAALAVYNQIAAGDPVLQLRQRATLALGLLRSGKTVEPLVQLSNDERPEVRGAAALAMAATQSKQNDFSQALKEMTADEDPYVQERAAKGLEIAQRKSKAVLNHFGSTDTDIRLFAAHYFHHHGRSADVAALKRALKREKNEDVRAELQKAVKAIEKRAAKAAPAKPDPPAQPQKSTAP